MFVVAIQRHRTIAMTNSFSTVQLKLLLSRFTLTKTVKRYKGIEYIHMYLRREKNTLSME